MKKVITYGTFDLLHQGHINLLKRAKDLGDYLIVGVTADDFDKKRGKINVHQSLMKRIESVKETGLADEIIVEEYEGQKIDDINRYEIDVFTVGSDWVGKFDYLSEYCEVKYLDRTEGISSSQLRTENRTLKLGIIGNNLIFQKFINESKYVNGLEITSLYTEDKEFLDKYEEDGIKEFSNMESFLSEVDAVYVVSSIENRYSYVMYCLKNKKHVICESPIAIKGENCIEMYKYADDNNLILMESIKTAYIPAFNRLILLAKSGSIGKIVSVETSCTSLKQYQSSSKEEMLKNQNSMVAWGPTALYPIFSLLGTNYKNIKFTSYFFDSKKEFDLFTKIDINYNNAVASCKVGKGIKSEGELIISGTEGYIYVPAPWWKTDYFEIRYEDAEKNKRYFYQLDGEGIRHQLLNFTKSVENLKNNSYVKKEISLAISNVMEKFNKKDNLDIIE